MKIIRIEDLHADAGWRVVSFLKIVTDEGLIGWSEFAEARSTPGLTAIIRKLAEHMIGLDPRATTTIHELLATITRLTPGGLSAQACAAIENGCLDVRAKSLSLPVCDLFGGALRTRLPLYWSHCGTARVRHGRFLPPESAAPLRTLDDIITLGKQVRDQGYTALKTNVILFDGAEPRVHSPGLFQNHAQWPERNIDAKTLQGIVDLLSAQGIDDVVVTVGGTIPADDIPQLKELGVAAVFTPGAPTQEIIDFLVSAVGEREPR